MQASVIIINYNTFDITCQCIKYLIEQTRLVEYEIILVDNASTEKDPSEFLVLFPQIKLIRSTENLGFAKGNNAGIAKAKGDFIVLLNSDAFLTNDAVSMTSSFLEANPNVAVATGKLVYPDGSVQHNCQRFPAIGPLLFELFRLQKFFPRKGSRVLFGPFFNYEELAYPDWVWGTFFIFRRSLLAELPENKLAEDFFMYGEDMQWCMEFKKRGYQMAFLPEPRIVHLLGASGASKQSMIATNHRFFLRKYYSTWRIKIIDSLNPLLSL